MYTPEIKIEHFLDSMGSIFLYGHTNGLETKYKSVMHSKREIPVSSCTSEIDNIFYASTSYSGDTLEEEKAAFQNMLERLDERAEAYEVKKPPKKRQQSKFSKKLAKGITGGQWYRVDTDGKFWIENNRYLIDDQEIQYQPIPTDYGDYYAMDKILYANGRFYDMNYDEVTVYQIGGILPYKSFIVGEKT